MKDSKVICDRCHIEVNTGSYPRTPAKEGWKNVEVKLGQYNAKNFDLCPKCLDELGLIDKHTGDMEKISEQSTQDKVFELLIEIVNQAIDERG